MVAGSQQLEENGNACKKGTLKDLLDGVEINHLLSLVCYE